eukprot:05496_1
MRIRQLKIMFHRKRRVYRCQFFWTMKNMEEMCISMPRMHILTCYLKISSIAYPNSVGIHGRKRKEGRCLIFTNPPGFHLEFYQRWSVVGLRSTSKDRAFNKRLLRTQISTKGNFWSGPDAFHRKLTISICQVTRKNLTCYLEMELNRFQL